MTQNPKVNSDLPHWAVTEKLDEEMKRQLELKDKPKEEKRA